MDGQLLEFAFFRAKLDIVALLFGKLCVVGVVCDAWNATGVVQDLGAPRIYVRIPSSRVSLWTPPQHVMANSDVDVDGTLT